MQIIGEDPWESPTAPLIDSPFAAPPSPPSPPPPPAPHTCTFYAETDYNGGDVANAPAKTAEECCALCWANKDCSVFTFETGPAPSPDSCHFRQTGGCSGTGPRQPTGDQPCDAVIPCSQGSCPSGYCECKGGVKKHPVSCNPGSHPPFSCGEVCATDGAHSGAAAAAVSGGAAAAASDGGPAPGGGATPTCWMKSHVASKMTNQPHHTAGACNGRAPPSTSNGQTVFSTGPNDLVGTFFPYNHQLAFAEGIAREKLAPPAMMLSRATTAGSWRLGGASWDGDHHCDFNNYLNHLYGALDSQLSGQLWWSVDVGGFFCQMDEETMCRDFMLAVTSPMMRQHGNRDTRIWGDGWTATMTATATKAIKLRDSLRGYVHAQLAISAANGVPLQRYLWHDFPEDAAVWEIADQFMFGDAYLVAPVVQEKAVQRSVYFPKGATWVHYSTGAVHRGGETAVVLAPLDEIAMYHRRPEHAPNRYKSVSKQE